jgi:hypothetical protein
MCLRTISEYKKRSPQMRHCHWSRANMYGRHSELLGSSLESGILMSRVICDATTRAASDHHAAAPPSIVMTHGASCLTWGFLPLRAAGFPHAQPSTEGPAGPFSAHTNSVMGSSLAWYCLRRLLLFNFRPAKIKECPHDDRKHWPFRASRIACDICLDLSDKQCIR